jgi:hypothetical protein
MPRVKLEGGPFDGQEMEIPDPPAIVLGLPLTGSLNHYGPVPVAIYRPKDDDPQVYVYDRTR